MAGLNFPWLNETGRPGQPQFNNQKYQVAPIEDPSYADQQMNLPGDLWQYLKNMNLGNSGKGSGGPKIDEGFGWNKGSADMVSAGLGGIGNLARGWAAIKGLGIAQNQLDENKRQYNQNFGQQMKAYDAQVGAQNNRTREVNAWKTAQGRTDMRDLIPV
jgi:hypothetical protein